MIWKIDTALARTEILKHSSEITMKPHHDRAQRFYVAEGNWDLLGKAWTEATSRSTGGFGWLRGAATYSKFHQFPSLSKSSVQLPRKLAKAQPVRFWEPACAVLPRAKFFVNLVA